MEHSPETRRNILQTMRENVPFIALCAEKNGVARRTMEQWLQLGRAGDPRYEKFTNEVYKIRAEYMLNLAKECMSADKATAENAKWKGWMLQRLDRSIFDPPKEVYEKVAKVTQPDEHAHNPTAADPNRVAEAIASLTSH